MTQSAMASQGPPVFINTNASSFTSLDNAAAETQPLPHDPPSPSESSTTCSLHSQRDDDGGASRSNFTVMDIDSDDDENCPAMMSGDEGMGQDGVVLGNKPNSDPSIKDKGKEKEKEKDSTEGPSVRWDGPNVLQDFDFDSFLREEDPSSTSSYPVEKNATTSIHSQQDYSLKLMQLEQRNKRNLKAQRAKQDSFRVTQDTVGPNCGDNYALQDYQMQLMLLDNQNKNRRMMARVEPEAAAGTSQSNSAPVTTTQPNYQRQLELLEAQNLRRLNASKETNTGIDANATLKNQTPTKQAQYDWLQHHMRVQQQQQLAMDKSVQETNSYFHNAGVDSVAAISNFPDIKASGPTAGNVVNVSSTISGHAMYPPATDLPVQTTSVSVPSDTNYKCNEKNCSKSFSRREDYWAHMQRCNSIIPDRLPEKISEEREQQIKRNNADRDKQRVMQNPEPETLVHKSPHGSPVTSNAAYPSSSELNVPKVFKVKVSGWHPNTGLLQKFNHIMVVAPNTTSFMVEESSEGSCITGYASKEDAAKVFNRLYNTTFDGCILKVSLLNTDEEHDRNQTGTQNEPNINATAVYPPATGTNMQPPMCCPRYAGSSPLAYMSAYNEARHLYSQLDAISSSSGQFARQCRSFYPAFPLNSSHNTQEPETRTDLTDISLTTSSALMPPKEHSPCSHTPHSSALPASTVGHLDAPLHPVPYTTRCHFTPRSDNLDHDSYKKQSDLQRGSYCSSASRSPRDAQPPTTGSAPSIPSMMSGRDLVKPAPWAAQQQPTHNIPGPPPPPPLLLSGFSSNSIHGNNGINLPHGPSAPATQGHPVPVPLQFPSIMNTMSRPANPKKEFSIRNGTNHTNITLDFYFEGDNLVENTTVRIKNGTVEKSITRSKATPINEFVKQVIEDSENAIKNGNDEVMGDDTGSDSIIVG